MTTPAPRPLLGRSRPARIDRAYRALRAAIAAERKAARRLERARAAYLETIGAELAPFLKGKGKP